MAANSSTSSDDTARDIAFKYISLLRDVPTTVDPGGSPRTQRRPFVEQHFASLVTSQIPAVQPDTNIAPIAASSTLDLTDSDSQRSADGHLSMPPSLRHCTVDIYVPQALRPPSTSVPPTVVASASSSTSASAEVSSSLIFIDADGAPDTVFLGARMCGDRAVTASPADLRAPSPLPCQTHLSLSPTECSTASSRTDTPAVVTGSSPISVHYVDPATSTPAAVPALLDCSTSPVMPSCDKVSTAASLDSALLSTPITRSLGDFVQLVAQPVYTYDSLQNASLTLAGDLLHVRYPTPNDVPCPFPRCSWTSHCAYWKYTLSNMVHHLKTVHYFALSSVVQWCGRCRAPFLNRPADHPCFLSGTAIDYYSRCTYNCPACSYTCAARQRMITHLKKHSPPALQSSGQIFDICSLPPAAPSPPCEVAPAHTIGPHVVSPTSSIHHSSDGTPLEPVQHDDTLLPTSSSCVTSPHTAPTVLVTTCEPSSGLVTLDCADSSLLVTVDAVPDSPVLDSSSVPATPAEIPPSVVLTPSAGSTPLPPFQDAAIAAGVSRVGSQLQLYFPLPPAIGCTEPNCDALFSASRWTIMRHSLMRHMERKHRIILSSAFYWCGVCRQPAGSTPNTHPCVRDYTIRLGGPHPFACSFCDFSHPNIAGLNDHLRTHRSDTLRTQSLLQKPVVPPRTSVATTVARGRVRRRGSRGSFARGISASASLPRNQMPRIPSRHPSRARGRPSPALRGAPPPFPSHSEGHPSTGTMNPGTIYSDSQPAGPSSDHRPVTVPTTSAPVSSDDDFLPDLHHPPRQASHDPRHLQPSEPVESSAFSSHRSRASSPLPRSARRRRSPPVTRQPVHRPTPPSPPLRPGSSAPARPGRSASTTPNPGDATAPPLPDLQDAPPLLREFLPDLHHLSSLPVTTSTWSQIEDLLQRLTQRAGELVHLPPPQEFNSALSDDPSVEDASGIQRLFKRNPKRAVRVITGQSSVRCSHPPAAVHAAFADTWASRPFDPTFYTRVSGRTPLDLTPFDPTEVLIKLKQADNTSPGGDRLTYSHWRSIDPEACVITKILNLCLKHRRVPTYWRLTRTVLLPKPGLDSADLKNCRPIALCPTIYKLFTKCLTARLIAWTASHSALSFCQKGFLPSDGVFEHNYVLEQRIRAAKLHRDELLLAWVDISNAFGSLPHGAIFASLEAAGLGDDFVTIIRSIYADNQTQVITSDGLTDWIPVNAGVRQGCPLSGLLFDFAIDPVLQAIQGSSGLHHALAYCDDIVILEDNTVKMQRALDKLASLLSKISLSVNCQKTATLHLSGQQPVGARPTSFHLGDVLIPRLDESDIHKNLGKPISLLQPPPDDHFNHLEELGTSILTSKLAPWQRLDALRKFYYPSLNFPMRIGRFSKTDWATLDAHLRPLIKDTLYLTQSSTSLYLHAARPSGLGLPVAPEDSDIYAIDSAFKLLSSRDLWIRNYAITHLLDLTKTRLRRDPCPDDIANYLTGVMEDAYYSTSNPAKDTWTAARNASRRLTVRWTFTTDYVPSVSIGDFTIDIRLRHVLVKTLRDHFRALRQQRLLDLQSQGKAIECATPDPASTHFLFSGEYTRFADWRFIHRARLNQLPVNGAKPWVTDPLEQQCRRCHKYIEFLPHVLHNCETSSRLWNLRHNAILKRIRDCASYKWKVLQQNTFVAGLPLKPDLIVARGNTARIIDVTCVFDNRLQTFRERRLDKMEKYRPLISKLRPYFANVTVGAIVVGGLGSWDPDNDIVLKGMCSPSYLAKMKRLIVSDTIRWSRMTYIGHMTGEKQWSPEDAAALFVEPIRLPSEYVSSSASGPSRTSTRRGTSRRGPARRYPTSCRRSPSASRHMDDPPASFPSYDDLPRVPHPADQPSTSSTHLSPVVESPPSTQRTRQLSPSGADVPSTGPVITMVSQESVNQDPPPPPSALPPPAQPVVTFDPRSLIQPLGLLQHHGSYSPLHEMPLPVVMNPYMSAPPTLVPNWLPSSPEELYGVPQRTVSGPTVTMLPVLHQ